MGDRLTIKIDHREKTSRAQAVITRWEVDTEVAQLPVGDYVCGPVGVEVKEMGDLIASVWAQKLGRQLFEELVESYEYPCLVIIGSMEKHLDTLFKGNPKYRNPKIRTATWKRYWSTYHGITAALAKNRKLSVHRVDSEEEFAYWLVTYMQKCTSEHTGEWSRPVVTRKAADRTIAEEVEDVLCAVGGIGRKQARNILAHTKTLRALFNARPERLANIPGIGAKRAERLYNVGTHRWEGDAVNDE